MFRSMSTTDMLTSPKMPCLSTFHCVRQALSIVSAAPRCKSGQPDSNLCNLCLTSPKMSLRQSQTGFKGEVRLNFVIPQLPQNIPNICNFLHINIFWVNFSPHKSVYISTKQRKSEKKYLCFWRISKFSTCGVISEFSTSVMWRNLKYLFITDVDKFPISPHLSCGDI